MHNLYLGIIITYAPTQKVKEDQTVQNAVNYKVFDLPSFCLHILAYTCKQKQFTPAKDDLISVSGKTQPFEPSGKS